MNTKNKRFISITDDLTGAADSGSYFTDRGMNLTIFTGLLPEEIELPGKGNFSVNLSTRNASQEDAFKRHYSIFRKLEEKGLIASSDALVMKKIGTGFRGRDSYEIGGMLAANPKRLCFVVDSAPDLGTFTLYGNQYCEGCILDKSLYAKDPVLPPECSYIPHILQEGQEWGIASISIDAVKGTREALLHAVKEALSRGNRILVYDAITREDLYKLVTMLTPQYPDAIWTGSLGIGAALAEYLTNETKNAADGNHSVGRKDWSVKKQSNFDGMIRKQERCACFTASAYEATMRQIEYSRLRGLKVVSLDMDSILDGDRETLPKAVSLYLDALAKGNAILKPVIEKYSHKKGVSALLLSVISECARVICQAGNFDRLVVIGGETAQSILDLLDVHIIELKRSPEIGIAAGMIKGGDYQGKRIVLKGGSIGSIDALEHMMGKM